MYLRNSCRGTGSNRSYKGYVDMKIRLLIPSFVYYINIMLSNIWFLILLLSEFFIQNCVYHVCF